MNKTKSGKYNVHKIEMEYTHLKNKLNKDEILRLIDNAVWDYGIMYKTGIIIIKDFNNLNS